MSDLSLEKLKIVDRLQATETAIALSTEATKTLTSQFKETMERMEQILNKHDDELYGREDRAGIKISVDRLIQTERSRTWLLRVIVTAIIGLVSKLGVDIFSKHQ